MGKKLSVLMILALLCATLLLFGSCFPTTGPGEDPGSTDDPPSDNEEWKSDETHHWKDEDSKEEHTFGEWTIVEEATCTKEGTQEHVCSVCEYKAEDTIEATGHTYSENWRSDETYHWHPAACGHTSEVSEKAKHTFENGACTVCEEEQPATAGIVYTKPQNKRYYVVSGVEEGTVLEGTVILSAKQGGYSVQEISASAFAGQTGITSVIIPEGVKVIGEGAFDGCTGLKSIQLPSSLTTLDAYAFRNCASLESVTFTGTKVAEISAHSFEGCVELTEVTIPSGVTAIGAYAFNGCTKLATVTYSTTTLKSIGARAFGDCAALATVDIAETVTSVGAGAYAGTAAETTALAAGNVFIADHVILKAKNTLTDYSIPDSVRLLADRAFENCTNLILATVPASTKVGAHVFDGCVKMEQNGTLKVAGECVFFYHTDAGYFELIAYNGTDTNVVLPLNPSGIGAYKYIHDYAFAGNTSIVSVEIRSHVTTIGDHAFDGCTSLERVINAAGIEYIGEYAFRGCTSLVEYPFVTDDDGSGVWRIGAHAFHGCISLTSITLPSNLWNEEIGENTTYAVGKYAFANCSNLENLIFLGDGGQTTFDEYAFLKCNKLHNLYVTSVRGWTCVNFINKEAHPFNVFDETTENKFFVLASGEQTIANATEVTELDFESGAHSLGDNTIHSWTFLNCERITSLKLGGILKIDAGAFLVYGDGGLATVTTNYTNWRRHSSLNADGSGSGAGGEVGTITAEDLKTAGNSKFYFRASLL